MTCDEMRPMIGDLLDGELSAADVEKLESHLGECAECRAERAELDVLLASTAELERQITPSRDLWRGIESRIATADGKIVRGPWWSSSWLGWAAAAGLVVALGVQMMGNRETPEVTESVASAPDRSEIALVASVSEAAHARDGLLQVRTDLLRSITERRDSLDSETRQMVDENLLVIDQAIADIFHALQENPENRGLEFLLASTYQHEVSFLKQMNLL
jgi:hypothetical protein